MLFTKYTKFIKYIFDVNTLQRHIRFIDIDCDESLKLKNFVQAVIINLKSIRNGTKPIYSNDNYKSQEKYFTHFSIRILVWSIREI